MTWTPLLIFAAVLAAFFLLKRVGLVSADKARQLLREGALVIDVRSPGEFNAGHLDGVLNLPLDELAAQAPRRLPDKNRALLLHCLSGGRSGIARHQLRRLGYANVFNLGSYSRAARIVPPPAPRG